MNRVSIDVRESGETWSMQVATTAVSIVEIGVDAGKVQADAIAALDECNAVIVSNNGAGEAYFTFGEPIGGGSPTNPREVLGRGGVVYDYPADTPAVSNGHPLPPGSTRRIDGYKDVNRFRIVSDALAYISVTLLGS